MTAKVRRRTTLALGVVVGLAIVHHELPDLVAWKIRRELAARGFDDARFRVVDVDLDRIELADVELAPGLMLGTVELDAGIALLWRDLDVITIRGARVVHTSLPRLRPDPTEGLPARTVRVEDSVVVIDGTEIAVSGTIDLSADVPSAQLVASSPSWRIGSAIVRDLVARIDGSVACATAVIEAALVDACTTLTSWGATASTFTWRAHEHAWGANGTAHVEWSSRLSMRGHADLAIAAGSHRGATFDDVAMTGDFAGTRDVIDLIGTLRMKRARTGELVIEDVETPFAVRAHTGEPRVELRTLVGTAREVVGRVRGERVRASDLGFRVGPLILDSHAFDSRVEWNAKQLEVGTATLREAGGTIGRDSFDWRARELRIAGVHLFGSRGSVRDGAIVWAADSARWNDVTIERPSGRISATRVIDVSASRARWKDVAIHTLRVTGDPRGTLQWRAAEVVRGRDSVRELSVRSDIARDRHDLTWRDAHVGRFALDRGELSLAVEGGRWSVARASVAAYGGLISVSRSTAITAPIVLHLRGIHVGSLVSALTSRTVGNGLLDGTITLRGGELEGFELHARGAGSFQVGDRSWVDTAVASIAAGHVAVSQRIGGALADFEYARLGVVMTPTPAGPALRIELRGTGRRVRQELDLVINVRGLREAARLLTRAQGAS